MSTSTSSAEYLSLTISKFMLDLEEEVIVAGLYNRLKIWDSGKWSQYKKDAEKNFRRNRGTTW